MEQFSRMGIVLWDDPDLREVCVGKSNGKTSGICTAYLYICAGNDRMGIFLQSVFKCGDGLPRRDVRRRSQRVY